MPGSYTVTMVSGVPVVTAPPEIDSGNADALRTVILDTMAHGHATFVVDMTATGFCDSAGLHALLRAHRRARAEGGEARLVITSSAVLRIFAITGVDRLIPNFATVPEAVAPAPAVIVPPPRLGSPEPADPTR
ncbi:MAG TPA: STAS domain-containing protein [Streptosporangiaceae bacterium]|jgi:anti-sigma B factor antagonist